MGRVDAAAAVPREAHTPRAAAVPDRSIVDRRELSAGRTLVILRGNDAAGAPCDELEVRSPAGQPEVRITFGPDGPVVSLRAARLELAAPTVAVRCDDLDVRARRSVALGAGESVAIASEGDCRVTSVGDVHLNGAFLRLNCTDDAAAGHDGGAPELDASGPREADAGSLGGRPTSGSPMTHHPGGRSSDARSLQRPDGPTA